MFQRLIPLMLMVMFFATPYGKFLNSAQAQTVSETSDEDRDLPKAFQWFKDAWDRAAIDIPVRQKILEQEFGQFDVGLLGEYKWSIEPANIDNLQMRTDYWRTTVQGDFGGGARIGVNGTISVLFGRLFPTGKAKIADIKYFWKFPRNSQMVQKMVPGEFVQLLMQDNIVARTSDDHEFEPTTNTNVSASASANRQAQLRIEIYKKRGARVRVRILAIKVPLNINYAISVNPISTANWAAGLGLIGKPLDKFVDRLINSCRLAYHSGNFNFSDATRPDTSLGEYVLDLEKPEGREVFDSIMNLPILLQVMKELNKVGNQASLDKTLLKFLTSANLAFQNNLELPEKDRSVHRSFMGRALSDFSHREFGSSCASQLLYSLTTTFNQNMIDLFSMDEKDQVTTYKYLSSDRTNNLSAFFKIWQVKSAKSIHGLFLAQPLIDSRNIHTVPTKIQDILVLRDESDKSFSRKKVEKFKNHLKFIDAELANSIQWGDFDQRDNIKNGYLRFQFIFHSETFGALQRSPVKTQRQIYDFLRRLVDEYPSKQNLPGVELNLNGRASLTELPLLDDEKTEVANGFFTANALFHQSKFDRFEKGIRELTLAWWGVMKPVGDIGNSSAQARIDQLNAFARMSQIDLTHEIGVPFIVRMIKETPGAELKQLVRFDLISAGGKGIVHQPQGSFGPEEGLTPLYRIVRGLLDAITGQRMDVAYMVEESDLGRPGGGVH